MSGNNGVCQIHMFIRQKYFDLDVQLQFVWIYLNVAFGIVSLIIWMQSPRGK